MKRRKLLTLIGGAALSIGLVGLFGVGPLPAQNQNQSFTFGLFGDLGYVPSEEPWLANVLCGFEQGPGSFIHRPCRRSFVAAL